MARLLILWVDESLEDRARSLSAELRAPERTPVAAVGGAASRIASHDARSRSNSRHRLSRQLVAGVARESCISKTTVRIAYQRNSSFLSDRLVRN